MLEKLPPEWRWKPYQQAFGNWLLKTLGWRVQGEMPLDLPKYVIAAGPHTALRDVPLFLAAIMAAGRRVRWITADVAMRWPYRRLMQNWGAIIIRYKQRNNLIPRLVEMFHQTDNMVLVIAPEGNIYKVPHWRSGFYHIAYNAGVPVVPLVGNFGATKEIRWGSPIALTGNIKADMDSIRAFFAGAVGKYPDRMGEVKLAEEEET